MRTPSRAIAGTFALIAGLLIAASCSPSAKSPQAAAPADTAPAAAKPAAASSAGGNADWDKIVAAAKQEGKVVVAGGAGEMFRQHASIFQQSYPDITLEFTGVSGPDFTSKLVSEQKASQFFWDVHIGGLTNIMVAHRQSNTLDSVRSAMLLPEVLDDTKWRGGFEDGWADNDRQYVYAFAGYPSYLAYVNRDLVPKSELSSIDQLLGPQWNGKIAMSDPTQGGAGVSGAHFMFFLKGEDWYRKFLGQGVVPIADVRQLAESLVRGRYPVALAIDTSQLAALGREGLTAHIEALDSDNAVEMAAGFGHAMLVRQAPHPNAAKVFVNWLLSQAGQKAYAEITGLNSRRLDVASPPGSTFDPDVKYQNITKEKYLADREKARQIARELLLK